MLNKLVILPALGLTVGLTTAASAVPYTYSEDFESTPVGTNLPAGFNENNGEWDVAALAYAGGTNAARSVNGVAGLEIASYTGDSDNGIPASNWVDYTVTGLIGAETYTDASSSLFAGNLARLQSDGSGYGFRVGALAGSAPQLIRLTDTGGVAVLSSSTQSTTTMDAMERFAYTFSVINDDANSEIDLSISITTESGTGITLSTATSVAYSDATAITGPGVFALLAQNNAARFWSYDDIQITGDAVAVPEPASVALIGLGGVCLLGRRRRV